VRQPPPAPDPDVLRRLRRLRWTSFALVSAAYVLSFFHRIAPNAIAGELRASFDATGAQLGALAAAYFWLYTPMQVPTGVLVDRLGPRRIVALGGVVAGLGSIVFGRAQTLGAASAGRALVGLGVSVAFVALLKLVTSWFRESEFSTISGAVMAIGNLGAIASATPLAWAASLTSWRNVFAAVGASSLAGAAVTWALVRDRPEDAGLPSMRRLEGHEEHAPAGGGWGDGLRVVLRNPATWPGFFVNLGLAGAYLSFAGLWAGPYLRAVHGATAAAASAHTTLMLAAFAASSFAVGWISDRLRLRRAPMLALGVVHVACWLPLLVAGPLPPAATFALFALLGASAPAFTLSWASVKEVNPPALAGTAMAVVNTGVFLGPVAYQPLVGWVVDRAGFAAGLSVLAACAFVGVLATLFVRETRCRNVTSTPPSPAGGGSGTG
jgi:sugar phosphate permease